MVLSALVLIMSLAAAPVSAGLAELGLEAGEQAVVTRVVDGDTVVLEDGREVRLVGIMAPKLALGRAWMNDQPLSHEAKAALEALVLNRTVILGYGGARLDRHGRLLAHLLRDDGAWVQGAMLEAGMARVYTFADNRAAVAQMLALEGQARDASRGIWAEAAYAVRPAEDPHAIPLDSYELIEGVVREAADIDRRIFLNFGENWKTDVTATISPADRAIFRATHVDLLALEGKRVRVRGWTGWRNGPSIVIDHPEQIEVLD